MKTRKDCSLLPYIREDLSGFSPGDIQFYGWEIKLFNIDKQWRLSKGEGVRVAVIDTGCDLNHDDLKNNIGQGINIVKPGSDPLDDNGHGTHVSGTIAASNNSIGMVGVAPSAKIIPIKALNGDGNGKTSDVAEGVRWAANNNCDFITMSLGNPNYSELLKKAIDYANKKGCVVFCAAGNAGDDHSIMYPAAFDNVISIGALDRYLKRTRFTCSGEELDFLSPGHDIISCVPNNSYANMSGTSMATPFAVGFASLLLSYRRLNNLECPKTVNDYIDIFKSTARSLKDPKHGGNKRYEGYGILYPSI